MSSRVFQPIGCDPKAGYHNVSQVDIGSSEERVSDPSPGEMEGPWGGKRLHSLPYIHPAVVLRAG